MERRFIAQALDLREASKTVASARERATDFLRIFEPAAS
jgi:hypothetical protein